MSLTVGKRAAIRINDRGPFVRGRCIDLSRAAANAIGMGGTARVRVD
nr:septal ring lytic transglycosylase RlpA family protein [Tardiphaga sp. vice304]